MDTKEWQKFKDLPFVVKFATIWVFVRFGWWLMVLTAHVILFGFSQKTLIALIGGALT
jgi:hypothetical protein